MPISLKSDGFLFKSSGMSDLMRTKNEVDLTKQDVLLR